MTVLKGLVAVEFKKAGHIIPQDVKDIADGGSSLTGGAGTREGTLSILQQAIRYGYHYGVDCIYVTDYINVIILKLPRCAGEKGSNKADETYFVDWAVIERKEARLILAFLLWDAMVNLSELLKEADKFRVVNAEAAMAERQAALRRPQMVSGRS